MTDPTTTTAPVKQPLLPDGTQPLPLGSGTIVSLLGKGGMAVVYRIWNKELGVHRAVKLLRNASDPENLRRFRTEISVTAQLRHPNIVVIHTTGEWQGVPFVEMEEIDGETLDQLLHSWGALPVPVATAAAMMLCRALDFAHKHKHVFTIDGTSCRGVLHSDLKPHNIILQKDGVVKLMDFGTVTPLDSPVDLEDDQFIGSLQYASPEQVFGRPRDPRSDLYSLEALSAIESGDNKRLAVALTANAAEARRMVDQFITTNDFDTPSFLLMKARRLYHAKDPGAAALFLSRLRQDKSADQAIDRTAAYYAALASTSLLDREPASDQLRQQAIHNWNEVISLFPGHTDTKIMQTARANLQKLKGAAASSAH